MRVVRVMNIYRRISVLVTLVFMLLVSGCSSTAVAPRGESIYFMTIPSNATTDDAINSIRAAAIKRGWTFHEIENDKVQVELKSNRYKAELEFSFSDNKI